MSVNGNIARTMAALLSPKQLNAIRVIANSRALNAETECLERMRCQPEELTRWAASELIDWLKSQPLRWSA